MNILLTFDGWKKLFGTEMNFFTFKRCKGHQRKSKIVETFKLYYCLFHPLPTYSHRVSVWKDLDQSPTTSLGEQVQGEHLPLASSSVQGHPSSALHCWHWWRCGLHQSGCYLHQSHCGPLSGLSFGGCFILPDLFFLQMGLRLTCQGFSPRKRKVGAQQGAPVMVVLSVSCAPELQSAFSGVKKKSNPKCKCVFPKWRPWARWPELAWSCLAFCLSFCVSSCDLFQFESCSCILVMRLWVLCQYNFQNARKLMFLRHSRIAELRKASKNGFRHASVLSCVLFAARCNLSIPIGYGWAVANTTDLADFPFS